MEKSPAEHLHWYALKVFYNKVFDVEQLLKSDGIESYIPCKIVTLEVKGVPRRVRKTLIPSLMFFRSTEKYAVELQTKLINRVILYTRRIDVYKKRPAPIPDSEMEMFIFVTSVDDQGLECFPDNYMKYKEGQRVRVIGGPFKGAVGTVKRIKHNRRLTVTIEGVCMVATSFIEPYNLEKLD